MYWSVTGEAEAIGSEVQSLPEIHRIKCKQAEDVSSEVENLPSICKLQALGCSKQNTEEDMLEHTYLACSRPQVSSLSSEEGEERGGTEGGRKEKGKRGKGRGRQSATDDPRRHTP